MLPRDDVIQGLQQELAAFAELVRSLDERAFAQPSRCQGWTVADVAAHLIGAFADVTSGRIEGQGTPEVSERQAAERRGRSASELADELDQVARRTSEMLSGFDEAAWASPARGGYNMTLGQAMQSLWSGAYVHADDIRAAIGRPSERGPGLLASVHNVAGLLTQRGWGPAVLALEGVDEVSIGGTGGVVPGSEARRITGDPLAFVLAATGRANPVPLGLARSVNVFA
jgi:uncharacterized protein (TIGR03083 family)